MTFTTKTRTVTAASLIALLAAAPVAAQETEAEIGAGATTASTLGVDTGLSGDNAAGAETDGTMVAETEGMEDEAEAPEATVILASDESIIGNVDSTTEDPSGRVIYSVLLDPSLGLDIERVAFSTSAEVNAEGELTLDMTGEEFAQAVQTRIDAMGGAGTATN